MTDGSSQGLFVIVAVVIFGIFVLISYVLFRDNLKTSLANIFTDGLVQATNSLKDKGVPADLEENSIFKFDETTGSVEGFIDGYSHDSSELIIPQKINGVLVRNISPEAFFNETFTDVILPEGLENIGNLAFYKSNVTDLNIPDSVREIGSGAFQCSEIKTLDLGNGVVNIMYGAFYKSNVTDLKIPDTVREIGISSFGKIKKLTLGNGVEFIGEKAFYGLETADDLIIPDSVRVICANAFGKSKAKKLILSKNIETIVGYAFGEVDLTNLLDKSDYKNLKSVGIHNPIFK
ncbi:leucine-rich repeat domain-containing protein [Enterococcus faecalis]|uniref:leucine-rich repeat domain-containing protein n=2 Tax=Enterococcus faecalis TaxID=1351 RepID=UPI00232B31C2|nr:leucine-rich repeat domain-containing protein [Enterococcus faecalis]MDB1651758.1 leucine-rich repeat domain-containing protein [Enterococcus faecalis]